MSDTSSLAPSCPGRDQLWAFLQGELPDEVALSIAEHIPTCPTCETSLLELARHAATDPTRTALPPAVAPTVAYPGAAPHEESSSPELFGRFLLLNRLAAGGMGVVYRVLDTKLKRIAALKRLSPTTLGRADAHARFARECEAIARLDHPNVVRVYEAGVIRDEPYLVMEYIRGGTLAKGDRPNPMSNRDVATMMETVARAVHYAHTKDVFHRDLKPNNVLVGPNGVPKVADFGLALILNPDDPDRLTRTGEFLGTPQYMAPEQVRGDPSQITNRTDVYGLGALLYDLLANQAPFSGTPVQEVRERVLGTEPVPPSRVRPDVDPHLEAVCLKCLEKDPAKRYASAHEVADDLALWCQHGYASVRPANRLTKAVRWFRRHPATTIALLLALATAVAAPFVYEASHPDRAAKAALRKLEHGESVTLIDADGRPQVRPRVLVGSASLIVPEGTPRAARPNAGGRAPVPGEPFVIEGSNDPALVELLPTIPTLPYRLTAELYQDSQPTSQLVEKFRERVGVYFATQTVAAPVRPAFVVHLIAYSEFRPIPSGKQGIPTLGPGKALHRIELFSDLSNQTGKSEIKDYEFTTGIKMRTIQVDVSSDRIDWWCDGLLAGTLNTVDIPSAIEKIKPNGLDVPDQVLNLRGSCGLYVQSATLHVRAVSIEPMIRSADPFP